MQVCVTYHPQSDTITLQWRSPPPAEADFKARPHPRESAFGLDFDELKTLGALNVEPETGLTLSSTPASPRQALAGPDDPLPAWLRFDPRQQP